MSWKEDVQDKVFEIVTGDGKSYYPKWLNATKQQDYHVAVYNFVGVEGSYADRKFAMGRKFPLEFYYDGDDAVALGNNFELSSRDKRKWLLKHPFYGNIYCQPLGLSQDNSVYNVTKFSCTVIETIKEGYPVYDDAFEEIIVSTQEETNVLQAEAFAAADEVDKNLLLNTTNYLDTVFSSMIDNENDLNVFKAKVETTVTDITNTVSSATQIIRSMQDMITYPATIIQTVASRFNAFSEALGGLIDNITGIFPDSRTQADKFSFEAIAGAIVAAQQIAVSSEIEGSYNTRNDVIEQQELILADYDSYLTVLDENQTDRNDTETSYVPNYGSMNEMANLLSISVANLFSIAFDAKQERTFVNDKDSNAVLLSHKFYGGDLEDEQLEYFIETNNISLDEILSIKKGRELLYYV